MQKAPSRKFIAILLPWILAAAVFVIYAITLGRHVSTSNVALVAQISGWDWHPVFVAPLHYVVTLPIRWMAPGAQHVFLNGMAALFATFSLLLLARSVALLPYDRTREQRQRPQGEHNLLDVGAAWLPPMVAVLVCAFQLTFWEHAVIATGEMLDLLLFAYVIRCLLEWRIDQRDSWLYRMALVYGLGLTNNYAFIGYAPLLLGSLIWICKRKFFRLGFLATMALCLSIGLLLYLLLPIIHSRSAIADVTFWKALKTNLVFQKGSLLGYPRNIVFVLSLGGLLPLLLLGIRWPSSFGDTSSAGARATNLMLHVMHGGLLAYCLVIAFDPPFGPRALGYGVAFLTFYYLGALAIGYFVGYFLLVFGSAPIKSWQRAGGLRRAINLAVVALVWAAALAVPVALLVRNFPHVRERANGYFDRYARLLARSLPSGPAIVVSDDPIRLYATRAVASRAQSKDWIFVDSVSLPLAGYHQFLKKQYSQRWPELRQDTRYGFSDPALQEMMAGLVARVPVYYLHSSFGYYFERNYLTPEDMVFRMRPLATNDIAPPIWSPALIQAQEKLWSELAQQEFGRLTNGVNTARLNARQSGTEPIYVGSYYSKHANNIGVELQRARQWQKAAPFFKSALAVNSMNASAAINHEFNVWWRQHQKPLDRFSEESMGLMKPFQGNWDLLLTVNGFIDEPNFAESLMERFLKGSLPRQGAQEALRVLEYSPTHYLAQRSIGQAWLHLSMPQRALEVVTAIRQSNQQPSLSEAQRSQIVELEAAARFANGEVKRAEQLLREEMRLNPRDDAAYTGLTHLYLASRSRATNEAEGLQSVTNALAVLEAQMRAQPTNISAHVNYGGLRIMLRDYTNSLPALSRAIELDPSNASALLNRAIAHLQLKQPELAERDYARLIAVRPRMYQAYYGLGQVATERGRWREAIRHFEEYLRYAPDPSAERDEVNRRIAELKKK